MSPVGAPVLVTFTDPQLSVYKAAISASVGPVGMSAKHRFMPVVPAGIVPTKVGAVLSPPECVMVWPVSSLPQLSATLNV